MSARDLKLRVYVLTHTFGEDMESVNTEVMGVFTTEPGARACVEGREGRSLEWKEHNAHGHYWHARHPRKDTGSRAYNYTIEECEVQS